MKAQFVTFSNGKAYTDGEFLGKVDNGDLSDDDLKNHPEDAIPVFLQSGQRVFLVEGYMKNSYFVPLCTCEICDGCEGGKVECREIFEADSECIKTYGYYYLD